MASTASAPGGRAAVSGCWRRLWRCSGGTGSARPRWTRSHGLRTSPGRASYLHFANKDALFRAAVRQELDTALGDAARCLDEEGVGLEQRVVAALDAWLGRYVGSMLAPDIGNLLQNPAMQLGDIGRPGQSPRFDAPARCGDRSRDVREGPHAAGRDTGGGRRGAAHGGPRREIPGQRAGESREECVARMTAAVRVLFAGFGTAATRTP